MAVEENNAILFISFKFLPQELLALRFKHQMNVLQAACYFSSENIVKYLRDSFIKFPDLMRQLVEFQEPYGGNQALHFAVLKGNYKIVDILINDFKAKPQSVT